MSDDDNYNPSDNECITNYGEQSDGSDNEIATQTPTGDESDDDVKVKHTATGKRVELKKKKKGKGKKKNTKAAKRKLEADDFEKEAEHEIKKPKTQTSLLGSVQAGAVKNTLKPKTPVPNQGKCTFEDVWQGGFSDEYMQHLKETKAVFVPTDWRVCLRPDNIVVSFKKSEGRMDTETQVSFKSLPSYDGRPATISSPVFVVEGCRIHGTGYTQGEKESKEPKPWKNKFYLSGLANGEFTKDAFMAEESVEFYNRLEMLYTIIAERMWDNPDTQVKHKQELLAEARKSKIKYSKQEVPADDPDVHQDAKELFMKTFAMPLRPASDKPPIFSFYKNVFKEPENNRKETYPLGPLVVHPRQWFDDIANCEAVKEEMEKQGLEYKRVCYLNRFTGGVIHTIQNKKIDSLPIDTVFVTNNCLVKVAIFFYVYSCPRTEKSPPKYGGKNFFSSVMVVEVRPPRNNGLTMEPEAQLGEEQTEMEIIDTSTIAQNDEMTPIEMHTE